MADAGLIPMPSAGEDLLQSVFAIELWEVSRLIPYAKNAKLHPEEHVARLAKHIARVGWDQPIVVDADGVIIKGHGRRLAAIKLGRDKVPVLVRRDLSKAEADAARIGDNAVVGLQFDTRLMQEELNRLMAIEDIAFSIDDLGLSAKEQDLLLRRIDVEAENVLIEDTSAEIEAQKTEEERKVSRSDREEMPLAEAFGFKRVTRENSRLIQRFMAMVEEHSGKEGGDALIHWIADQAVAGAL